MHGCSLCTETFFGISSSDCWLNVCSIFYASFHTRSSGKTLFLWLFKRLFQSIKNVILDSISVTRIATSLDQTCQYLSFLFCHHYHLQRRVCFKPNVWFLAVDCRDVAYESGDVNQLSYDVTPEWVMITHGLKVVEDNYLFDCDFLQVCKILCLPLFKFLFCLILSSLLRALKFCLRIFVGGLY